MNLEKEFEKILSLEEPFIGFYEEHKINNKLIAKQCSELSQDIAIKFAEFISKGQWEKFAIYENQVAQSNYKYSKWGKSYELPEDIEENKCFTTQELFTLFLKDYEKESN